ncbi:MAG: hypothetical protein KAG34_01235 [Cocleimonas sp.]|nr:hypothetical protein [Sulfurovaceae bacterium]MCK5917017.1 hypothetical protein [Cocleimonas sp.]
MRKYDSGKPLILIHMPKTAGISVREIYKGWFGKQLLFHYYDGQAKKMPVKYDLEGLHSKENPIFVYGHFNRSKKFGAEQYYPEVDQFVTILRNPFEMAVSGYFYVRKINQDGWRKQLNLANGGLPEYLQKMHSGLLHFFPCEMTLDNYKEVIEEKYIEIGVTEYLDESMQQIAAKLGQNYASNTLERLNVAKRDQIIPYNLQDSFRERHQLEFAVYDYVLSKYI